MTSKKGGLLMLFMVVVVLMVGLATHLPSEKARVKKPQDTELQLKTVTAWTWGELVGPAVKINNTNNPFSLYQVNFRIGDGYKQTAFVAGDWAHVEDWKGVGEVLLMPVNTTIPDGVVGSTYYHTYFVVDYRQKK